MRCVRLAAALGLAVALNAPSLAQAQSTGSVGCAALTQAAAGAIEARVQADDAAIPQPTSVRSLTCLDSFFRGVGLNVIASLLDPGSLLDAIEGQICATVSQAWQSALGSAQCGLTISGFNLGFGGLGGGVMCPRLSFGGGGPPIGTFGTGNNTTGSLYVNGSPLAPTGYTLPAQ
ncbi:hypothetical protein [Roseomonas mucosa]|uniref:hypothetical protein n=1 Tax=Roseomonas mucosa TaxID=207340 RepID=UPI0038510A32